MITKESLMQDLRLCGIPQDRPVLVHASLKKIGNVEGGAETVLEALREHITAHGGILMIPTHTWANLLEGEEFALDLMHHIPCLGVLPKVAAVHPDAIISQNPTHSIAFFGDASAISEYIKGEEKLLTPAAPEGCYGKLSQRGGTVLLLGVDQTKNTFLHAVEEKLVGNLRYNKEPCEMKLRLADGKVISRPFYAFDESEIGDVSERFGKFEAPFRKHGAIRDGKFGEAKTQLCSAEGLERVMRMIYERAKGKELLADETPIPAEWY